MIKFIALCLLGFISIANDQAPPQNVWSYDATITAYNSDESQTDSTPFITATGERVRIGGCAVSRAMEKIAPMGTTIIIDGMKYYVNDRMNQKKWNDLRLDIYMLSKEEADIYGKQKKVIIISP